MKFYELDAETKELKDDNILKENLDELTDATLYLGGKNSGIIAVRFDNKFENYNCEKRVIEALSKKYPSNLVFKTENEYKFLYKTDKEVKTAFNSYTNIGILVDTCDSTSSIIIKRDGKLLDYDGELNFDKLTPFPDVLLPLINKNSKNLARSENSSMFNNYDNLYSHLLSVKINYNYVNLQEIADFINLYVFDEPMKQSEIDSIVKKVNSCVKRDYKALAEYEEREIKWLYYPYIPLGAITILAGDPGCGKSQISVKLASIISTGASLPFSDEESIKNSISIPSAVVMQNGEDDIEQVIKPRLTRAGGDHDNVYIIDEEEKIFTLEDLEKIEKVLKEVRPKLIVIDPLQRYIGNINLNNLSEVTACLKPVSQLAQKYSCAILIIMHMNKGKNKSLYRINGSIGLVGIARSVLTVEELEDDEDEKVLLHTKSNLGKQGLPIVFDIDDNGVNFIEQRRLSDIKLKGEEAPKTSKRDIAKDFIVEILKSGELESTTILSMALEKGIKKPTLDRAKEELKVICSQKDRKWFWKLQDNPQLNNDNVMV